MPVAKKIEFNHVKQQAQKYSNELSKAFQSVLQSGVFLRGPFEKKLVTALTRYISHPHIIPVKSGHDALLLTLQSLQLPSKSEVLFQVNAYPTAFPIAQSGYMPVGVDCDEHGQIDIEQLSKKCTTQTRAVVITHMYGSCCDIGKVQEICKQKNLILIEDCAQAFGSFYQDKPLGSFGQFSCFSFYPTKNLGTLGDGGVIATSLTSKANWIAQASSYGEQRRYQSQFVAGHSRFPELQAAALFVYLKHFNWLKHKRQIVFKWYEQAFANHMNLPLLIISKAHIKSQPVVHLFVIATKNRDQLQNYLRKKNIETGIHYPFPVHSVPAFKQFSFSKNTFPIAEQLSTSILSLPFHQFLTKKEVTTIVEHIARFYEN